MAAGIAWLLNLDADLELQDPARYHASRLNAERVKELAAGIADLIAPDDLILDPASPQRPPGHLTILAFCPTPSALRRIEQLGLPVPPAPASSILRQVNDRAFCAALGHGLAHSCFARDMTTLEQHLVQPSPTGSYVIKRAFSFAGREQRRVHDGLLDASTRGFCLRSVGRGEGVQIEPWVERLADFGRYGYLTRDGALLIGSTRELRCDPMGRFVGMSTASAHVSDDEDRSLAAEVKRTAAALTAAGYFGPFGIDAFRYRTPAGGIDFNPRCEINARFTMGYPRALLLEGLAQE
jgi:hypothetical protein